MPPPSEVDQSKALSYSSVSASFMAESLNLCRLKHPLALCCGAGHVSFAREEKSPAKRVRYH